MDSIFGSLKDLLQFLFEFILKEVFSIISESKLNPISDEEKTDFIIEVNSEIRPNSFISFLMHFFVMLQLNITLIFDEYLLILFVTHYSLLIR